MDCVRTVSTKLVETVEPSAFALQLCSVKRVHAGCRVLASAHF